MTLSEFLKPVLAVVVVAALAGGYYWIEHRSHPEEKETPGDALVIGYRQHVGAADRAGPPKPSPLAWLLWN